MLAYVSVGNRLYIGDNLYNNLHYHTLTYSKFFIECMHTAVSEGNRLYIGDNRYSNLHYHTLTYSKSFIECMYTAACAGESRRLVNNIILFA